jgi:hypothetical protein
MADSRSLLNFNAQRRPGNDATDSPIGELTGTRISSHGICSRIFCDANRRQVEDIRIEVQGSSEPSRTYTAIFTQRITIE